MIRRAVPADATALAELGERTFRDAFAADNRPEDLEAHLAATYASAIQAAELADPSRVVLVAEEDGGTLAAFSHLRFGAPPPPGVPGAAPAEVLRFYVERRWHGHGLADRLMRATLEAAAERGAETLWLGVWERNARALAFYRRNGFRDVGSHVFLLGSDAQTDRLLTRPVTPPAPSLPERPGAGRASPPRSAP